MTNKKYRVPQHDKPLNSVFVEDGATRGATFGVDLFWPDGKLVTVYDIVGDGTGGTIAPPVQNPTFLTTWAQVAGKPRNITEAAALTGVGLVVRQSDGNWTTRAVLGTSGNITVANGSGDAGNPTLDLADVPDSGMGALLAITRDGKGRISGSRPVEPSDLPDIAVAPGDYVALDSSTGTLVANRRAKTMYQTISGSLSGEMNVTDGGVRYGAFHYIVDVGSSYDITGVIGGQAGAYVTITNDPSSLGVLGIANEGAGSAQNNIKTPSGDSVQVEPGNSITLRYAVDATLANPGYWVFDATTSGGGVALNHRVDDVEAVTGDIRFVLDKEPYQDRVAIYDDGGTRLKLSMMMGTGRYRYLLAPATGGEIYTVDYWTEGASPGATTMDSAPPVVASGTAPDGNVGNPYSYTFTVTGGDGGPYTWAVLSGALPAGLTLDEDTGEVSGTPTTEDAYSFTLRVTDSGGTYGDTDPQSVDILAAADPYWANVSSLLYGNSATSDETGKTWVVSGTVTPDPTMLLFGLPMLKFVTAGSTLTLSGGDDDEFDVGGGDWTYEVQAYLPSSGVQAFFSKRSSGSAFEGFIPLILGNKMSLLATHGGGWDVNVSDANNVPLNQVVQIGIRHIASLSKYEIWLGTGGGAPTMVASQTLAGSIPNNTATPVISEPGLTFAAGTLIAQQRITKGVARDLSNAQTQPWPNL